MNREQLFSQLAAPYRTPGTREGRALKGFSMGGHGALHLAFRHPDQFGAVSAFGHRVSRQSRPVDPFEIMDGLYFVGNSQVSAHLLTTADGLVLLDSTMPHQVPWLLESIRTLGFEPREVKVVVGGHSHVDHIGGHWYFQQHCGA